MMRPFDVTGLRKLLLEHPLAASFVISYNHVLTPSIKSTTLDAASSRSRQTPTLSRNRLRL